MDIRFLPAMALVLLLPGLAYSQTSKTEILELITRLEKSIIEKDSVKMNQLLHEDFIGTSPRGDMMKKQAYISFHCRPGIGLLFIDNINPDSVSVRFYGNVAVVNRRTGTKNKFPDGTISALTVQRTEICLRRNGKWVLVSGHGTHVNPTWRPGDVSASHRALHREFL
jgi:hypothetical protein